MAEARPEDDEESMRRDVREQVVRRQSNGNEGRSGRRKPENRLSQGPLWSLRAAIKRTTSRSSFSDTPRDRNRDEDPRVLVARRPDVTILSAEPLPSPSWLAGRPGAFPPGAFPPGAFPPGAFPPGAFPPGAFPPPPPPAAQIWGPTIPPSIQPPPSYDEVIREKTQELAVQTSPSLPSSLSPSHPAYRTTIATQTDTGSSPGAPVKHVKPQRTPGPAAPSQANAEIGSPLTAPSDNGRSEQPPRATPLPNEAERPRSRPRAKPAVTSISNEVKVQTLVKLREDGLATLAARARCDISKQDASQGKYLQELLEAFSSDDWGLPEERGDDSGLSQSDEEDDDNMAAMKARIQAFEQQQKEATPEGNRGASDINEEVVAKKPEPRPRPRLQSQPTKVLPPTVAPKPKSLHKSPSVDSAEPTPEVPNSKPRPITEPLPTRTTYPSPCATPVPAPRLPPPKATSSASETPSTKSASRPPIAPRTSVSYEKVPADKHVAPTRPPRPSTEVSEGSQTQDTVNLPARSSSLKGSSLETNPVPCKAPALHAKLSLPNLKKAESICDPPLPPRPSNVKQLPPRPPSIKSVPARPPPPAVIPSANKPQPQAPSSFVAANHRASKRGPPLPPRPRPGHLLFPTCTKQQVLIILDDLPPEAPPSLVAPLHSTSECLIDLDVLPSEPSLQTRLPPSMQEHPKPLPVSPRYVALFDFEGADANELTFSQGDAIELLEIVDQQWGRGQLYGRVGLFPVSFTRVTEGLPPESPVASMPSKAAEVEEWAVALFDFPGQTAEDLPFHKGAYIQVTEHVDAEWRRGRLDGREGLYPAAFTQTCQAPPITSQKAAGKVTAKALFAFTAEKEDELTVKPGDIITQVECADEQWIEGVVGGKRGIVPKNYIELL
ncbi:uncharacterized protein ACBT44_009983 isoform 2-T2 [Syngnathus typhle]